jgi:adenylyl cyclase-associated protein
LVAYVKEFHRTGLSWNPKGVPVGDYKDEKKVVPAPVAATTAASATKTSNVAPPPPKSALFSELNKDAAITSGLKKVTKDMQTWRAEYKTGFFFFLMLLFSPFFNFWYC